MIRPGRSRGARVSPIVADAAVPTDLALGGQKV
jgi:hypothetical protein